MSTIDINSFREEGMSFEDAMIRAWAAQAMQQSDEVGVVYDDEEVQENLYVKGTLIVNHIDQIPWLTSFLEKNPTIKPYVEDLLQRKPAIVLPTASDAEWIYAFARWTQAEIWFYERVIPMSVYPITNLDKVGQEKYKKWAAWKKECQRDYELEQMKLSQQAADRAKVQPMQLTPATLDGHEVDHHSTCEYIATQDDRSVPIPVHWDLAEPMQAYIGDIDNCEGQLDIYHKGDKLSWQARVSIEWQAPIPKPQWISLHRGVTFEAQYKKQRRVYIIVEQYYGDDVYWIVRLAYPQVEQYVFLDQNGKREIVREVKGKFAVIDAEGGLFWNGVRYIVYTPMLAIVTYDNGRWGCGFYVDDSNKDAYKKKTGKGYRLAGPCPMDKALINGVGDREQWLQHVWALSHNGYEICAKGVALESMIIAYGGLMTGRRKNFQNHERVTVGDNEMIVHEIGGSKFDVLCKHYYVDHPLALDAYVKTYEPKFGNHHPVTECFTFAYHMLFNSPLYFFWQRAVCDQRAYAQLNNFNARGDHNAWDLRRAYK